MFIQIVIKGCMESPAIRTILILLSSIVASAFIPHWVGLLATSIFPGAFPSPAWIGGVVCLTLVTLVVAVLVAVYIGIYECVKNRMGRKR